MLENRNCLCRRERAAIAAYRRAVENAAAGRLAESFDRLDRMGAVVGCRFDEQAEKLAGPLTILVNNAGVVRDNLLMRMKAEDWDAVLRINLYGAYHCIKEVLPGMVRQRYGRIVNLASVVAQAGNAGQANYVASKAGLIGLTKAVATEVARRNITVNAVAPGFIATPMTEKLPNDVREKMLAIIPVGRMGTDRDVAHAIRFLASEEAGYITGHVLNVNGGMYMA